MDRNLPGEEGVTYLVIKKSDTPPSPSGGW
jgi:hypothetical protein